MSRATTTGSPAGSSAGSPAGSTARGRARSPRAVPADPARLLAWEVLRAVDERGAYANLLLSALIAQRQLPLRDRGFATELTYGTLRATGVLDALLATVTSRPVDAVDPKVRDALRLGAYQLLYTRVPPRAAVASTVDLVRHTSGERPVRFANAVLRRVASRVDETGGDLAALLAAPSYEDDPIGHLALVTAHPRWVVEAFAAALGGDLAETRSALAADDQRPTTHLVARPGLIDAEALLDAVRDGGLAGAPGLWSPYAVRLAGGDPGRLAEVTDGRAGVQDEGSQLVVTALSRVATQGTDTGVSVDLCAGPGGKTAVLAGLLPASRLVALEPRAARARLVTQAVAGRSNVLVTRADGRRPPLRPGSVDRVLADVPCTGLGALRRRPEARWRRAPSDAVVLSRLQRLLLTAALDLARPGGVVAYVTCSPHPAETTDVVTDVAARRADVSVLDARVFLPEVGALGDGPFVQLWPHRHGTDAMFLALLRRT
ncbi:RsmB/NOP family class I SAM-dependent RNA methyltransferase [Frankia sp. CiP3]|uniref:RsmB/NOP family class I SAM-dependent RNA methyltransferase n=1 Tax=Frankia sp. CiP3 TaxID=2880971 RepID=UPI001EF5D615|nr:transcription antitermination factor NusB [Frankia sp. CiP3]